MRGSTRRRHEAARRAELCPADYCDALVVHISNFRPVKRVDRVVEVFRRIRQRVRARLLLIGDGPVRGDIERQAAELGLRDEVIVLGEQQDPVPWLLVADVFLLPSAQESFGLAALEAMACEVPVIASDVGGLPEIISDGETGFLCAPDDVEGMAQRAIELLADRGRRLAMGAAAANEVRTRYCTDRIVPLYEAAYENVLK